MHTSSYMFWFAIEPIYLQVHVDLLLFFSILSPNKIVWDLTKQ